MVLDRPRYFLIYAAGSSLAAASDPTAAWCLHFSGGAAAADYCFTPQSSSLFPNGLAFAFKLPWPDGTSRIALLHAGQEVASLSAASAPPALSILSPLAGDQWQGTKTVRWTGTDPDGNSLVYSLLYSADNGATWMPLAVDLTDSSYDLDCSQIAGGNQVLLRVTASSGLSSASATVYPGPAATRWR